tara:strand:+ start:565 stop:798 length:234 start_codon:yes stop_codon:yes gene_type:complete
MAHIATRNGSLMKSMVGQQLVSSNESKIHGEITDHFNNGEEAVFIVNDDWEVTAEGCEQIIFHSNKALPAVYVREAY